MIVENVLLREMQLPALLKGPIEVKQQAEQDALRMNFILQKQKLLAERKRIEAQGYCGFPEVRSTGNQPAIAGMEGHRGHGKLATMTSYEVVIVGNSRNGLRVILGPQ